MASSKSSKTLYQRLCVTSDDSQDTIRDAYETLVAHWSGVPGNADFLDSLRHAYGILSNPMKRAGYDQYGLRNILEDEDGDYSSVEDPTPPNSGPSTPTMASVPTARPPLPKVSFQLPKDIEQEKQRREIRRMWEPAQDHGKKAKPEKSKKSGKSGESGESKKSGKSDKNSEKKPKTDDRKDRKKESTKEKTGNEARKDGSSAKKDHKADSHSRHEKKHSDARNEKTKTKTSQTKSEKTKSASKGEKHESGSRERAHRKLKSTDPPYGHAYGKPIF